MNLVRVLLLVSSTFAKKLFTKVVQTPIIDSDKICNQHHVVLLNKNPFVENQREYSDMYAIDFSPSDDITDSSVVWKIFTGKKVKGKIRLIHFDHFYDEPFFSYSLDLIPAVPIETLNEIDRDMYRKVMDWNPGFQLYTHNCQHFGRYLSD